MGREAVLVDRYEKFIEGGKRESDMLDAGTLMQLELGSKRYVVLVNPNMNLDFAISNLKDFPLYSEDATELLRLYNYVDNLKSIVMIEVTLSGPKNAARYKGYQFGKEKAYNLLADEELESLNRELNMDASSSSLLGLNKLIKSKLKQYRTGKKSFAQRIEKVGNAYTYRFEDVPVTEWPSRTPKCLKGIGVYAEHGSDILLTDGYIPGSGYSEYRLPELDPDFADSAGGKRMLYMSMRSFGDFSYS